MCKITKFCYELENVPTGSEGYRNFTDLCNIYANIVDHDFFTCGVYTRSLEASEIWRYQDELGLNVKAAIAIVEHDGMPISWEEGKPDGPGVFNTENANQPRPRRGYAIRLKTKSSLVMGVIGYFGKDDERWKEALALALLITKIHHRVKHFEEQLHRDLLTDREIACLGWACNGKTAWEIGVILSISERTVVFHLNNATIKLNASNRQHACVIASALGLVSI